jgi:hypothetical protein
MGVLLSEVPGRRLLVSATTSKNPFCITLWLYLFWNGYYKWFHFFHWFFETGSHYVVQDGPKLTIILLQPSNCWDYRYKPSHLAWLHSDSDNIPPHLEQFSLKTLLICGLVLIISHCWDEICPGWSDPILHYLEPILTFNYFSSICDVLAFQNTDQVVF